MHKLVQELWGVFFISPRRPLEVASKYPLKPPSLKQTALTLPRSDTGCPNPPAVCYRPPHLHHMVCCRLPLSPTGCRRLRLGSSPHPGEARHNIADAPGVCTGFFLMTVANRVKEKLGCLYRVLLNDGGKPRSGEAGVSTRRGAA